MLKLKVQISKILEFEKILENTDLIYDFFIKI